MTHNHSDVGITHLPQPRLGIYRYSHNRRLLGQNAETDAGVTQFGAFEAVRVTIDRAARALTTGSIH
jgi:hypothetical protein